MLFLELLLLDELALELELELELEMLTVSSEEEEEAEEELDFFELLVDFSLLALFELLELLELFELLELLELFEDFIFLELLVDLEDFVGIPVGAEVSTKGKLSALKTPSSSRKVLIASSAAMMASIKASSSRSPGVTTVISKTVSPSSWSLRCEPNTSSSCNLLPILQGVSLQSTSGLIVAVTLTSLWTGGGTVF